VRKRKEKERRKGKEQERKYKNKNIFPIKIPHRLEIVLFTPGRGNRITPLPIPSPSPPPSFLYFCLLLKNKGK
jgi:hypothetical protein